MEMPKTVKADAPVAETKSNDLTDIDAIFDIFNRR
jgi:hypothetical protein